MRRQSACIHSILDGSEMPEMTGLEAIEQLRAERLRVPRFRHAVWGMGGRKIRNAR